MCVVEKSVGDRSGGHHVSGRWISFQRQTDRSRRGVGLHQKRSNGYLHRHQTFTASGGLLHDLYRGIYLSFCFLAWSHCVLNGLSIDAGDIRRRNWNRDQRTPASTTQSTGNRHMYVQDVNHLAILQTRPRADNSDENDSTKKTPCQSPRRPAMQMIIYSPDFFLARLNQWYCNITLAATVAKCQDTT